jgi:hypothetical protein
LCKIEGTRNKWVLPFTTSRNVKGKIKDANKNIWIIVEKKKKEVKRKKKRKRGEEQRNKGGPFLSSCDKC